jgi:hypothetical protein
MMTKPSTANDLKTSAALPPTDTEAVTQRKDARVTPLLLTLPDYQRMSGDGRTTVYNKIADGRLKAVKDGRRTKIIYESARQHLEGLPPAEVRSSFRKAAV